MSFVAYVDTPKIKLNKHLSIFNKNYKIHQNYQNGQNKKIHNRPTDLVINLMTGFQLVDPKIELYKNIIKYQN